MQSTIFLDTDPIVFTIPTSASSGMLSYTVADRTGTMIVQGQVEVKQKQTIIPLQPLPADYYVLRVTDHTAAGTPTRSLPFTILTPPPLPADARFGVSSHFSGKNPLSGTRELVAMGACMAREDALWADIEINKGEYQFASIDPFMHEFQQSGLRPLLILDYNNRWYDNGLTPYDEAGLTAYANYAKALVSHYGSQVHAVEVYNEYNGKFSTGPGAHNPANYAKLVHAASQAIKSIRPDVTIVAGATFGIDLDWFKGLFTAGALADADAISVHPYSIESVDTPEFRGITKKLQELQELIKTHNNGQTKPLWITELGWSDVLNITHEIEQAHYLVRSIMLSLSVGVQKYFWYDFLNDGTNALELEQNFGLIRMPTPDTYGYYTPKPAYTAFAVLLRLLAGRSFLAREVAASNAYHILFSENLHILWATPFNQKMELASDSPITAISLTGQKRLLQPEGGKVTLHLTPEPLYLLTESEHLTIRPLEQEPTPVQHP